MKKLVFTLLTILAIVSLSSCSGGGNSKSTFKIPSRITYNYSDKDVNLNYEFIFKDGGIGIHKWHEKNNNSGLVENGEKQFSYISYDHNETIEMILNNTSHFIWVIDESTWDPTISRLYYADGYIYLSLTFAMGRAYGNGKKVEVSW